MLHCTLQNSSGSQALTLQHPCNVREYNPIGAGGVILLHKIFIAFNCFPGMETVSQGSIEALERVGLDLFSLFFFARKIFWILLKFQHTTCRLKNCFILIHNGIVSDLCLLWDQADSSSHSELYNANSSRRCCSVTQGPPSASLLFKHLYLFLLLSFYGPVVCHPVQCLSNCCVPPQPSLAVS